MTTIQAEPRHPGDVLAEMMDARGWDQSDVASRMDDGTGTYREFQVAYLIVDFLLCIRMSGALVGHKTARLLSLAFEDTTPEFWMELDDAWQLWALAHN